jgi:Rrf2 family iron-sulfur cluster assembly transcriptional regulator
MVGVLSCQVIWLYIEPMRISSKSKIAFQILLDIAAHTAHGRAISIPVICRRHQLSHSYLENIFSQLKSNGLIRSHRGPGGGYSLAKKPEDISLLDVVILMNGQEPIREDLCTDLWANLNSHMSIQMKEINLSEALKRSVIDVEQSTKGFQLSKSSKLSKESATPNPKKKMKIVKPRLGPNSVFAFGKYLKSF